MKLVREDTQMGYQSLKVTGILENKDNQELKGEEIQPKRIKANLEWDSPQMGYWSLKVTWTQGRQDNQEPKEKLIKHN